jgi:hypothetical protein
VANLTDTHNITLHHKHTFEKGRAYYSVPAFGDGNCALNAFALWLVDAIKRNEVVLNAEKQQALMSSITNAANLNVLKERLKFYCGELSSTTKNKLNPYADVANDLDAFIQFIETKPTFTQLQQYINAQHSRHAIAALQVGLAPALRQIGVEAYINGLKIVLNEGDDSAHPMIREGISLFEDTVNVGHEVLSHLAHDFFHTNLTLYQADRKRLQTEEHNSRVSTCTILHSSAPEGHFNFLLSEAQVGTHQGLAADLAGIHFEVINNFTNQNEVLRHSKYLSQHQVTKIAAIAAEASKAVMSTMIAADEFLRTHAVKKLMLQSNEAVTSVKSKLDVSDAKLKSLGIKFNLQKETLQNGLANMTDDLSEDEIIARTMQNAEILSFYETHHGMLVRETPYLNFRSERVKTDALTHSGMFTPFASASAESSTDAVNTATLKKRSLFAV